VSATSHVDCIFTAFPFSDSLARRCPHPFLKISTPNLHQIRRWYIIGSLSYELFQASSNFNILIPLHITISLCLRSLSYQVNDKSNAFSTPDVLAPAKIPYYFPSQTGFNSLKILCRPSTIAFRVWDRFTSNKPIGGMAHHATVLQFHEVRVPSCYSKYLNNNTVRYITSTPALENPSIGYGKFQVRERIVTTWEPDRGRKVLEYMRVPCCSDSPETHRRSWQNEPVRGLWIESGPQNRCEIYRCFNCGYGVLSRFPRWNCLAFHAKGVQKPRKVHVGILAGD